MPFAVELASPLGRGRSHSQPPPRVMGAEPGGAARRGTVEELVAEVVRVVARGGVLGSCGPSLRANRDICIGVSDGGAKIANDRTAGY